MKLTDDDWNSPLMIVHGAVKGMPWARAWRIGCLKPRLANDLAFGTRRCAELALHGLAEAGVRTIADYDRVGDDECERIMLEAQAW